MRMSAPPVSKPDLGRVLSAYGAGLLSGAERVWWAPENAVYMVTTTKGKFVLKAYGGDKLHKLALVVRVMEFVERSGLPVPGLLRTADGGSVYQLGLRRFTVQRFIDGMGCDVVTVGVARDAGRLLGRMDACLLKFPLESKRVSLADADWPATSPKVVNGFCGADEAKDMNQAIKDVDLRIVRRSMVHGDAGGTNILQRNGRIVGIIDWDEVREGYLIQDPAVFMAHALVLPERINRRGIAAFMEEYQRFVRLNLQEKRLLYYFVLRRYLDVIPWFVSHADKNRVNQLIGDFVGRYSKFRSLPIREFLKLLGNSTSIRCGPLCVFSKKGTWRSR
jgi:Ser/Thr protein kinase RdoA (MazF antagonist)